MLQLNLLIIAGNMGEAQTEGYLHRGMAGHPSEHRFELEDHVRVTRAELTDGLFSIELVREIPEAMKPRKIEIDVAPALPSSEQGAQIESRKVAEDRFRR